MMKCTLITAVAAAAISTSLVVAPAILSPAAAQASLSVGLTVGVPPPAPVYEVVPAPRAGFVWAPGVYLWEGGRHVWHAGHWIEERRGYRYVAPRWDRVMVEGREHWAYHEGRWEDHREREREREHWDRDHRR